MNTQSQTIPRKRNVFQRSIDGILSVFYKSLNIRNKIIAAFLLVSLVSVGILTFVNDRVVRVQLTQTVGINLKNSAKSLGQTIGDQLVAQIQTLSALGLSNNVLEKVELANKEYAGLEPSVIQANIQRLDQQWIAADATKNDADPLIQVRLNNLLASQLRDFRNSAPDHVEIFVTDIYGALVATTNRTSDYNQSDEAWWQAAYHNGQGAVYIGQFEDDPSSGTIASIIAIPLYDNAHKLIGILRSTYQSTALANTLRLARLGKTGENDLLLPNSTALESNGEFEEINSDTLKKLKAAELANYQQFYYYGMDRLVSVASVTTLDPKYTDAVNALEWKVIADQGSIEALQPVSDATRTSFLTSIAVLALTFLLALFVSQSLSNPIIQLTKVAEQVRVGDLTAQAKVETRDEIGTLALAFNNMTARLSDQINNLEQKVAERTVAFNRRALQLQTAADAGKAIASIRDFDALLTQTASLIHERFGYYHVGIFLVDSAGVYAVLKASNSEGGRRMLERGHSLKVGEKGIVGYVTQEGKARIALDVGQDAVYFDNPDLPLTRSEMALPIIASGQQILGAVDVQSVEPEAFLKDDIATLQVLADQLAVAIQNARLFNENQNALEAARRAYGETSRADWQKLLKSKEQPGYTLGTQGFVETAPPRWEDELLKALQTGNMSLSQEGFTINIPVKVRGEPIGAIRLRKSENMHPWSQDETAMAINLTEQLSSALESARLFQDTQLRATRESLVSEISARINTTSHIDTILRETVQELGQVLDNATISFQLITPANAADQPPSSQKAYKE